MFEGGTIFTKGYHVAEARGSVDLSHVVIPPTFSLWDRIKTFLGVFA
jgi:hypothetical protein